MRLQYAHTSEFLELVSVPIAPCFSIKTVLAPSLDCNFRAIASPTAPAPITACVKSALRGALVENNLVRATDFVTTREIMTIRQRARRRAYDMGLHSRGWQETTKQKYEMDKKSVLGPKVV